MHTSLAWRPRLRDRTTALVIAVALVVFAGLLVSAPKASAHDVLVSSSPEVGETVDSAPEEIMLRFSGQLLSGAGLTNLIYVTDDNGVQWQTGETSLSGFELSVPVCDGLPQGEYRVSYRVIYSDGHTGEEYFTFTNADDSAPTDGTNSDCATDAPVVTGGNDPDTPGTASDAQAADQPAQSAGGLPVWMWIAGGVGVAVIAVVAVMVLRGTRVEE